MSLPSSIDLGTKSVYDNGKRNGGDSDSYDCNCDCDDDDDAGDYD